MTSAIIENVSATAGHPHLLSQTDVKPDVMGFYDAPTGSIQYVVTDPSTRKCVIIDPLLDFDPRSGSTRTTSADQLLRYIEAHGQRDRSLPLPTLMLAAFIAGGRLPAKEDDGRRYLKIPLRDRKSVV